MKIWNLVLVASIFPISGVAGTPRPLSLDFELIRSGHTLCKEKKEVRDGETFLFCGTKASGKRALVKVKSKIIPHTAEQAKLDPKVRDQVEISATVEEVEPSGRIGRVMTPQIVALDGEPAMLSVSETSHDGKTTESISLTVKPVIAN
jgi:energy-coupling factor transporter ATP-binding protein EcfA2